MTTLSADLEALMPEPVKLVTACEDCCGTGHTGESQYMGEFQPPEYERCGSCDGSGKWLVDHFTADQVREALLAAANLERKAVQAALRHERLMLVRTQHGLRVVKAITAAKAEALDGEAGEPT